MLYKKHSRWKRFYDTIKQPSWPNEPMEVDFYILPQSAQEKLLECGYIPNNDFPKRFVPGGAKGINVFYLDGQDGGGTGFGQDYIEVISTRYPGRVFKKCYEWCSGPGFIGYSLLDHGLVDSLCLTDIYDPSLLCAEETANYPRNNCKDIIDIYLLKDLRLLPAQERFDLVVANPPHANGFADDQTWTANANRISSDINWQAHQNFFANIKSHLEPDGVILLQENHQSSAANMFRPWIQQAGLKITDTFNSEKYHHDSKDMLQIYYIEIKHA